MTIIKQCTKGRRSTPGGEPGLSWDGVLRPRPLVKANRKPALTPGRAVIRGPCGALTGGPDGHVHVLIPGLWLGLTWKTAHADEMKLSTVRGDSTLPGGPTSSDEWPCRRTERFEAEGHSEGRPRADKERTEPRTPAARTPGGGRKGPAQRPPAPRPELGLQDCARINVCVGSHSWRRRLASPRKPTETPASVLRPTQSSPGSGLKVTLVPEAGFRQVCCGTSLSGPLVATEPLRTDRGRCRPRPRNSLQR